MHGKTQGFLVLNIRQDQYNSKTDNAEKMICDYFEPNKTDEPDTDSQVTATIKYVYFAWRYGYFWIYDGKR